MVTASLSETSVNIYKSTSSYVPEKNLHQIAPSEGGSTWTYRIRNTKRKWYIFQSEVLLNWLWILTRCVQERTCCLLLHVRNDHSDVAPKFHHQVTRKVLNVGGSGHRNGEMLEAKVVPGHAVKLVCSYLGTRWAECLRMCLCNLLLAEMRFPRDAEWCGME